MKILDNSKAVQDSDIRVNKTMIVFCTINEFE